MSCYFGVCRFQQLRRAANDNGKNLVQASTQFSGRFCSSISWNPISNIRRKDQRIISKSCMNKTYQPYQRSCYTLTALPSGTFTRFNNHSKSATKPFFTRIPFSTTVDSVISTTTKKTNCNSIIPEGLFDAEKTATTSTVAATPSSTDTIDESVVTASTEIAVDESAAAPTVSVLPDWLEEYERMQQRTKVVLRNNVSLEPIVLQELILKWSNTLRNNIGMDANHMYQYIGTGTGAQRDSLQIVVSEYYSHGLVSMYNIFKAWKEKTSHVSGTSSHNSSDATIPFESMLETITSKTSPPPYAGRLALKILMGWGERYVDIFERTPQLQHYHAVLCTYAAAIDYTSEDTGHTTPVKELQTPPFKEIADVALEILQHFDESYERKSYPNYESYAAAIQCMCFAIQQPNIDSSDKKWQDGVVDCLTNLLEVIPTNVDTTDVVPFEQFNALVHSLSDAIDCDKMTSQRWIAMYMKLLQPVYLSHWQLLCENKSRIDTNATTEQQQEQQHNSCRLQKTGIRILNFYSRNVRNILQNSGDITVAIAHAKCMSEFVQQLVQLSFASHDTANVAGGQFLSQVPTQQQFACTILAWSSFLKCKDAMQYNGIVNDKLQYLTETMEKVHDRRFSKINGGEAATQSFNKLMWAHLAAYNPEKVKFLWDMNKSPKIDNVRMRLNTESFELYLQGFASKRQPDQQKWAKRRALLAHKAWRNMVERDPDKPRYFIPNARMYGSVMVALSRSYYWDAGPKCQLVFDRMIQESEHDPDMAPQDVHYKALIASWGYNTSPNASEQTMKAFNMYKESGLTIDITSYSACMFSLCRCHPDSAIKQVEFLFEELESKGLDPDILCYNSLMYAWSRSSSVQSHEKCESVFNRLVGKYQDMRYPEHLKPTARSYALLIESLTSSQELDAGAKAETYLNRIINQAEVGRSDPPNASVYTAVMQVYCRNDKSPDSYRKVEAIMDQMKKSYDAGNEFCKPDAYCYTVLLMTLSRMNDPGKASKAWGILTEMLTSYERGNTDMQPTAYTFSAVLKSCAFTNSPDRQIKQQATKVAMMTFEALEKASLDNGMNGFAFRNMFDVVFRQVDDVMERMNLAKLVFQKCCEYGYVDLQTIEKLKTNLPDFYAELPKTAKNQLNLPTQWSRSV